MRARRRRIARLVKGRFPNRPILNFHFRFLVLLQATASHCTTLQVPGDQVPVMSERNRDKIFEAVELKTKPRLTASSSMPPGTNLPTATADAKKPQQYQDMLRCTLLKQGQYEDLNKKSTIPVGATSCVNQFSTDKLKPQASDTTTGGHSIHRPCSKMTFCMFVLVGIVAVLTVLTITGLGLVLINSGQTTKVEMELNSKLVQMNKVIMEISSQFSKQHSEVMHNIALVTNSTNDNAEEIQSQKIRIDDLDAGTNTNSEAIQSQGIIIHEVAGSISNNAEAIQSQLIQIDNANEQVTRIRADLNRLRNDLTLTSNRVGAVQSTATDASNKINMLAGQTISSNCMSRSLQSSFSGSASATTGPLTLSVSVYTIVVVTSLL